ncbi:pyridoxal phosphate-dependent aminotransferase [Candidatus Gottesmanbacteria bacterium]|nr:pyridoxal phosphate-dependent aminotransferase [Candidatus Gottesmanbacteria bacterium]
MTITVPSRLQEVPASPIRKLVPFAHQLPQSIIKTFSIRVKELDGVNLGQGIPSFPTQAHVIVATKKALNEPDIGVYPNFLGTIELREAIAKKLNVHYSLSLDSTREILVTVGAMEAFASSVLSLVSARDMVGVVTPDYCNHFPAIMIGRGEIHEIFMLEGKTWEIDLARMEQEARNGMKVLVLTNPNNPTGAVVNREQMSRIVSLANRYGFWLIADETYAFLDYSGTFASLLEFYGDCERILVIRSFSKEYAMTGWRVGYVIGRPSIVSLIAKTHDALVGCVPKISQIAAVAALVGPQDCVLQFQQILGKRCDMVCDLLDNMSEYLSYAKPQGAYYVFPKYKGTALSLSLVETILEKAHVAVIPGIVFGQAGEGHLRISFAVDDAVLTDGMKKLHGFFRAEKFQ